MPLQQNARLSLQVDDRFIRFSDRVRDFSWEMPRDPRVDGIEYRWSLEEDHAVCTLKVTGDHKRVEFVGPFAGAESILVPQYQGALFRRTGEHWASEAVRGGHTNLSLGMLGLISSKAALLLVPDQPTDWVARFGEDERGPFACFDAKPAEGIGWREMTVRIYPCDPGVTPLAMQYRKLMQARGQWKDWNEKISQKPSLAKLFGSLMSFIGYVQDDTTDYVAGVKALRGMGFDRVLAYPVRFAHYTALTMAGGRPPIALTDQQIGEMKSAGALVAPWAWTFEGKDDGSEAMRSTFRHYWEGPAKGWAMDGQQWYQICPPYQARHISKRLSSDMSAMDWLHFDVNATYPACACWNKQHDAHAGRILSASDAIDETRRLFAREIVGDRIVSSEGFNDLYTNTYDIGSTKMVPHEDSSAAGVPVPLTMLVYHDCCIHDWWELHNYNENPCWTLAKSHTGHSRAGRVGSGEPQLKAALDALYGCPPNVFPFGMQYGWVTGPGGDTYPFRMAMDDEKVKEALAAALPVTKLHGRIGKLPMMDFRFINANPLLQQTTFADGTRITANLSSTPIEVGGNLLPGHSWREERL